MPKREARKIRKCKCCGAPLDWTRLRICESCQAAGMGTALPKGQIDAEELLRVARERERLGFPPLEGMTMAEVSALAWLFPTYSSYGKFRAYVWSTRKLPPEREEKKR